MGQVHIANGGKRRWPNEPRSEMPRRPSNANRKSQSALITTFDSGREEGEGWTLFSPHTLPRPRSKADSARFDTRCHSRLQGVGIILQVMGESLARVPISRSVRKAQVDHKADTPGPTAHLTTRQIFGAPGGKGGPGEMKSA